MTAWGPADHHELHDQPPRVLLVDDAPINIQLLASALGSHYELLVARDGAAALDCIRHEPDLDLVLLDLHMPGLDGFEVLTWLREEFPERRLPVIFVTAAGDEQAQTRGFALGAVDYIVRPFSLPVVRARVQPRLHLRLGGLPRALQPGVRGRGGVLRPRRVDRVPPPRRRPRRRHHVVGFNGQDRPQRDRRFLFHHLTGSEAEAEAGDQQRQQKP